MRESSCYDKRQRLTIEAKKLIADRIVVKLQVTDECQLGGDGVTSVVFSLDEFKHFQSMRKRIKTAFKAVRDLEGCRIKELHVGGDYFIDFVNVNERTITVLYKARFDEMRRKLFRGAGSQIELTLKHLRFLFGEIKRLNEIPEIGMYEGCFHQNQYGYYSCSICRPLGRRDDLLL